MSVENGSIAQHQAFYGKRVRMPNEILTLESMATTEFYFDKVISHESFPPAFWTSVRLLIQNISQLSIKSVSVSEEKITADALLTAFGTVTTEATIKPHHELSVKAEETHAQLQLVIIESQLAFAAMLAKIREKVIFFHQQQLAAVPSEESDEKVSQYLSKSGSQSNEIIQKSFDNSQRAFALQLRKRKVTRKRIQQSLETWLNFTNEIAQTVLSGNQIINKTLQTASV